MEHEINKIIQGLKELYEKDCLSPFPYEGCRRLLADSKSHYDDFIPDLDQYFADLAGYCCSAKRLLQWPISRLIELQKNLQQSFFDQHLHYRALYGRISSEQTPDLYADLELHERMRQQLLLLIDALVEKQRGNMRVVGT